MINKKPLISVIISNYNNSRYLKKSIISILNQSFKNFELLIVDDCSNDESRKIIRKLKKIDKRIKFFENKKRKGLTKNLIKLIKFSKGEFIARQDSDDFSNRSRFKKQVSFLKKNNDYSLVGSLGCIGSKKIKLPTSNKDIRKRLEISNCFLHSSIMMRKNDYLKVGGYNSDFIYSQDYDLWLRISKIGKIKNFPDYLIKVNRDQNSISIKKSRLQNFYAIKANLHNNFHLIKKNKIISNQFKLRKSFLEFIYNINNISLYKFFFIFFKNLNFILLSDKIFILKKILKIIFYRIFFNNQIN